MSIKNKHHHIKIIRAKRAKLNIYFSLATQLVTMLCGLIVPRMLLETFGSSAYGATTAIAQFLSYVILLEGGVGGVARAALYTPLAHKQWDNVSKIFNEVKYFFRIIGLVFIVYTVLVACSFKYIAHFEYYDWGATFLLVVVISLATMAQYLLGISYSILLQTAQQSYINKNFRIIALVLNTIFVVLLVKLHCSLIVVKFASSIIFILPPIALYFYVKKHYPLDFSAPRDSNALKQKWTSLGQHLAYFFHNNTDITVLTILANLTLVAVYSVYNMVVSSVQGIVFSITTGMEALFGEMLAKKEMDSLLKTFSYYETLISLFSIIFFTSAAILAVPFIKLYTHGINDANYTQPVFAVMLTLCSLFYCLRSPYVQLLVAAGHFKQTRWAAYGEVSINIVLSVLLVCKYGLIGAAIGTLVAMLFRMFYSAYYLSFHIVKRPIKLFYHRLLINCLAFLTIFLINNWIMHFFNISSYIHWLMSAVVVTGCGITINIILNLLFYKKDVLILLKHFKRY